MKCRNREAHILINFDQCISPWNHHPIKTTNISIRSGKFSHVLQLSLNTQGQLLFWLLSLWTHFACSLTSSVQRHSSYIFVTVFFHSTSYFRVVGMVEYEYTAFYEYATICPFNCCGSLGYFQFLTNFLINISSAWSHFQVVPSQTPTDQFLAAYLMRTFCRHLGFSLFLQKFLLCSSVLNILVLTVSLRPSVPSSQFRVSWVLPGFSLCVCWSWKALKLSSS